jgi:hypothetical protein
MVRVADFGHGRSELIGSNLQGIFPEKEPVGVYHSVFDAFNVRELNEGVSKCGAGMRVSGDFHIRDVTVDPLAAFVEDTFYNLEKLGHLVLEYNWHILDDDTAPFAPVQQRHGFGGKEAGNSCLRSWRWRWRCSWRWR